MDPEEQVDKKRQSANWLGALRRAIDNLIKINQNLEALRQENRILRQDVSELVKLVNYQAGQIQQFDRRIVVAVEARVLREMSELSTGAGAYPAEMKSGRSFKGGRASTRAKPRPKK